jgi:hypothetical protein
LASLARTSGSTMLFQNGYMAFQSP